MNKDIKKILFDASEKAIDIAIGYLEGYTKDDVDSVDILDEDGIVVSVSKVHQKFMDDNIFIPYEVLLLDTDVAVAEYKASDAAILAAEKLAYDSDKERIKKELIEKDLKDLEEYNRLKLKFGG